MESQISEETCDFPPTLEECQNKLRSGACPRKLNGLCVSARLRPEEKGLYRITQDTFLLLGIPYQDPTPKS